MVSTAATVSKKFWESVTPVEALYADTEKVKFPAAVGIPLKTLGPCTPKERPGGGEIVDQAKSLAPIAEKVIEYGLPVDALGSGDVVVICRMLRGMVADAVELSNWMSRTVAVTEKVPPCAGVPRIAPVRPSTLSPAGRPVADHA
jgi:hypothetical protein